MGRAGKKERLPPRDFDPFDHRLGRAGVDRTAALARVDEGLEPDLGERPGLARRDVAEKMGDDTLGKVPALDLPVEGEARDLGDEAPVPADHAGDEPLMPEPVEAAVGSVPLPGGEEKGEIARRAGLEKPGLERGEEGIGDADSDEARGGQRVGVVDEPGGVGGGDDLVGHLGGPPSAEGRGRGAIRPVGRRA